jgi:potassium-dependent mechanosensitive channel
MKIVTVDSGRMDWSSVAPSKFGQSKRYGRFLVWWVFLSAWALLVWSGSALCAAADQTGKNSVQRIMAVQENMTRINRRIERERLLADQGAAADRAARNRNITRLQEIKFIDQRLLNALKKNLSLASEESGLRKDMESGKALVPEEKKPYSLSYYDKLLDQVAGVQQENEVLNTSIKSAGDNLDEARQALEKAEQTWRRIKEEVEAAKGSAAADDLRYTQAQLEREASQAAVELQEVRLEGLQRQLGLVDLKRQAAEQKLAVIRKDLAFDPAALEQENARLAMRENQLNQRLQAILNAQKRVELEWQADSAAAGNAAIESAMKAKEAWREAYETVLQQTEDMAQLFATQKKLWKLRYALVKGDVGASDLNAWEKEATAARQHTRQATRLYQNRQVGLQSRIAALEKDRKRGNPLAEKYASYRLEALNKTGEFGGEYLSTLLTTGQLAGRLLDEIATRTKEVPFWEKALHTGSKFGDIWNFELWVIDDNGVTVRKVVTALVILILGIWVVKRAIRLLSARLKRAKMQASAAAAAEKLLLYTGLVLVVLLALRTVNIPLTAFTFLGGAIAIGVGFGAQNLINNFISGFIIMAERPIRIGDLIELEGQCVRVEEIGARCTKVKTGQNIHILVPNSSFLENNIVNWTLSDHMIRTQVAVGVAYGSPLQQAAELLQQAAAQTERVLKEPAPFVIFDDFGDNALTFVVYFWVKVAGVIEQKRIASDVRYQIEELFNQQGIVIAFPQRDVHLDAPQPVRIELVNPGRPGKAPASSEKKASPQG